MDRYCHAVQTVPFRESQPDGCDVYRCDVSYSMLILVLSYLISKRVTLPLHRLQRIIQKTGENDLVSGQDSGQLFKLEHPGSIREDG